VPTMAVSRPRERNECDHANGAQREAPPRERVRGSGGRNPPDETRNAHLTRP
jgi:hypothetical protein